MIRNRTIICIASDWAADPTSKHHVMKVLARQNTILWVNYHGTRRPRATVADVQSAGEVTLRALRGPKRITDAMVQFTPLVLPGAHDGVLGTINRKVVVAQVRRVLRKLHANDRRPVQLWTFAPDVAFLAGRFDEERLVYYCVDEYREFEGYDARAIEAAERRLLRQADIVLTTSDALQVAKSALHSNVHLVRHGVDADHFGAALDPDTRIPSDVLGLTGPVVGFFGLIHHWIDVELIAGVARRLPGLQFVLIGPIRTDVKMLRPLPNVHLLGHRPYEQLPAYCAAFDLAILPFRRTELTRNVNPVKLREYLAAGLAVVSTPLPEAQRYEPDVTIADEPAAFADACLAAARRCSREDAILRTRRVTDTTWERVVEAVCPLVMNARTDAQRPETPAQTATTAVPESPRDTRAGRENAPRFTGEPTPSAVAAVPPRVGAKVPPANA